MRAAVTETKAEWILLCIAVHMCRINLLQSELRAIMSGAVVVQLLKNVLLDTETAAVLCSS